MRVEIFFDILEIYQSDSVQLYVKEGIDFTIVEEEISMLISKDSDPTESLFYIAGCILAVCKSKKLLIYLKTCITQYFLNTG